MENNNYNHHVETWEELEKEKVTDLIDTISKTQETYPEYRDFMAHTAYISFTYGQNMEEISNNFPESVKLSPEEEIEISREMGYTDEEILEDMVLDALIDIVIGEPDNSKTLWAYISHEFSVTENDPILDLFVSSEWISNDKNWTSFDLESSYEEKAGSLIFRFYNDEDRTVTIMLSCGPYNNKHGQVNVSERATIGSQAAFDTMNGVDESPENKKFDDSNYRDMVAYAYQRFVESGELNATWEDYGNFPESLDNPEILDVLNRLCQELRFTVKNDSNRQNDS